jgi:hypothetical protein
MYKPCGSRWPGRKLLSEGNEVGRFWGNCRHTTAFRLNCSMTNMIQYAHISVSILEHIQLLLFILPYPCVTRAEIRNLVCKNSVLLIVTQCTNKPHHTVRRIIFEKLTVTQLVEILLIHMEIEGSLPCSQKPATEPYLSQFSPVPILFLEDAFQYYLPTDAWFPKRFLPFRFLKLCTHLSPAIRASCLTHRILFDLITVIIDIFGEGDKPWNSSLCNILHPPTAVSILSQFQHLNPVRGLFNDAIWTSALGYTKGGNLLTRKTLWRKRSWPISIY